MYTLAKGFYLYATSKEEYSVLYVHLSSAGSPSGS
jgi:hypothetical protein